MGDNEYIARRFGFYSKTLVIDVADPERTTTSCSGETPRREPFPNLKKSGSDAVGDGAACFLPARFTAGPPMRETAAPILPSGQGSTA